MSNNESSVKRSGTRPQQTLFTKRIERIFYEIFLYKSCQILFLRTELLDLKH